MSYQVGVGEVAIVPTARGFRKATENVVDGAAKSSAGIFRRTFDKAGTQAGTSTGRGFRAAFEGQSTGFSQKATRELEQSVAKAARASSSARLKEQDAVGKVRVAEAQLAEARQKYTSESSQVIRAQERLATASRQLGVAQDSTRDATNDLRVAQGRLAAAADNAGDELADAGRRGGTRFLGGFRSVLGGSFLGSFFGNLGANLTAGLGNAIGTGLRAGVDFLKESTQAASGLNESLNAINVAYGPASAAIASLGEGAARRLGLSKLAFNEFATQFSSFANTIRANDPASFIDELTTRGADFASVYNIDVAEALRLFQSGLAGETEPLRRYGLDLSAATVEAYANGIGRAGTQLTEAQKQQARYGALLSQTAKVQGDFTNTSGELANQQRILAAEWENAQAKLGMALLPALTTLVTVANDKLIPVLNDVIAKVGPQLGDALTEATPALVDLATVIADNLPAMVELGAQALPLIIQGAQILVPLLAMWAENAGGLFGAMNAIFGLLSGDVSLAEFIEKVRGLGGVMGWAVGVGQALGSGLGALTRGISDTALTFGVKTAEIGGFIMSIPQRVQSAFAGAGTWLYNSGRALIDGFLAGIRDMFGPAERTVSGFLGWVRGFFPNSPAKRGPFSGAGWTGLRESGGALMRQWQSGMGAAAAAPPVLSAASTASSLLISSTANGGGASTRPMGPVVNQTNNFAHEDPMVAVDIASRAAAHALRG